MPPNSQDRDTDLPQPCDRFAEMFSVPIGQGCPWRDVSPATPQLPDRLHAVLSWLLQSFLEGCAAYAFGMYPCFPEASHPSDLSGPWRRAPAEQAAVAEAQQSPWQGEALVRPHPPSPGDGGMRGSHPS